MRQAVLFFVALLRGVVRHIGFYRWDVRDEVLKADTASAQGDADVSLSRLFGGQDEENFEHLLGRATLLVDIDCDLGYPAFSCSIEGECLPGRRAIRVGLLDDRDISDYALAEVVPGDVIEMPGDQDIANHLSVPVMIRYDSHTVM